MPSPGSDSTPRFVYRPVPLYRDPAFYLYLTPGALLYPFTVWIVMPVIGWLT